MRNTILAAILICLTHSCQIQNNNSNITNIDSTTIEVKQSHLDTIDKTSPLGSLFELKNFSSLYVYPDSNSLKNYPFNGKALNPDIVESLPGFINIQHETGGTEPTTEGYYSLGRFSLGNNATAFLARKPGYYVSSKIALWIYTIPCKNLPVR